MKKVIIGLLLFVISIISYAENEQSKTQNNNISIDQINDDSWMDKSFLVKRYNFVPLIKKYKNELGLTDEQLAIINQFYSKYYSKMVELAKSIYDKEKQLQELIIDGGDSQKIKDLIVEIAKKKAELTVYNIKEVRTIQSALTKEQFEKLKNLLGQNII